MLGFFRSIFLENAEKRCNFSKFLYLSLIFIMMIPEIYLIFDFVFDLIFTKGPRPTQGAWRAAAALAQPAPRGHARDRLELRVQRLPLALCIRKLRTEARGLPIGGRHVGA